jgi:hypothetical protein
VVFWGLRSLMILNFWLGRKASGSQLFSRHRSGSAFNTGHLFDNNIRKKPKTTFVNKNMRNKSREHEHWKVKIITKEQKNQYLWKSRKSWSFEHLVAKYFSARRQAKVRRKTRKQWNFFTTRALYL